MTDSIPPNAKMWGEDDRELVHEMLPGYMFIPEEYPDIRVGMWFNVEMGSSIRISDIPREKRTIEFVFGELGVDVEVPLVGVNDHKGTAMQAYKVEIQNWKPEGKFDD